MPDAARHYRHVETQLEVVARRLFPAGTFHFDFADVAKLGGGNLELGEQILGRMFRLVGPRSLDPETVRQIGEGSISAGRKVLQRFQDRLHPGGKQQSYALGGKVKMSKEAANYRDSAEDNCFCARCSMHQPRNSSCTLVAGPVHRVGLCDHFEKA
jgi:hypothetical protein